MGVGTNSMVTNMHALLTHWWRLLWQVRGGGGKVENGRGRECGGGGGVGG